jgi:Matrixin
MNHKNTLIAATSILTLISGAALGADTVTYPDSIASQLELDLKDIARSMIHSLTPAEQSAIANQGGLGAEEIDLSGMSWDRKAPTKTIPEGITATEYLNMLMGEDMQNELSEGELAIVNNIATLLDEGREMPYFCFAPGTDPKFAYLINELLDYQFVGDKGDNTRFQQSNRWSRTATDGNGLGQGDPTTITYSFVPDGTFVPNSGLGSGNSTLFAWLDAKYGDTATWQALFAQVFDRWAELTGLSYVHELSDDGATHGSGAGFLGVRGDVRIAAFNYPADGNFGVLAYNFFPNNGDMAIDAFDSFYNNLGGNSIRLRNVVAHENGHGLGMAHVCPANQTKLMEPFVSTSYDGPKLDDILNGQRFYGDPLEPNQSIGTATDLGTFGETGANNISEASIDDNSDVDFFKVTLTDRAKITFVLAPNAGQYQQGPQTGSCNSAPTTNYNSIHDLQIQMFSSTDLITPVATANATGAGGGETVVFDSEPSSGVYYIIVDAVDNINSIQRYQASLIITPLPPVVCPADLNDDGELNFFDVSAFLNAFNNQTPDGDFNNDGEYNFFDVSAFLNAFNAGCP